MRPYLDKEIQQCREHAAVCARRAGSVISAEAREDFLKLEQSWLQLARSYEATQRLMLDAACPAAPGDAAPAS
jgi:hypothetical protein